MTISQFLRWKYSQYDEQQAITQDSTDTADEYNQT